MWQIDGLIDTCSAAVNATTNASRLADDLEIYASHEFGIVELGPEVSRASALMPQKRNPYALPVIRGAAGLLLGKLAGVVAMQQTPRRAPTTCSTPIARSSARCRRLPTSSSWPRP